MATSTASHEKWPSTKVRDTFIDFFKQKGHTFVPSSSVVPHNDPTLLFANAGMNQYKAIFLGTVDPNSDFAHLKRAVNSQKCIRAGGKHNDLDDVGKDSYHHTFFEMLGNWSFADYFKKEAIEYTWELLTKVYGLEPERLYVTYFEGNAALGLEPDLETRDIWRAIGVPDDRILTGDMNDNWWSINLTGLAGPCTEVHYDRIGGRNVANLVNMDSPDVIEIWNNVFMQYNVELDGSIKPLPAKHVDTGMGFERLVSIVQDKPSNYDTDIFAPLFDTISQVTGARPYKGLFGEDDVDGIDTAYRVVADHVRTLTFAISDGAVPDSEGRGYVVRRVLRRGARYARKYLNTEIGSFFSKIVPSLVQQMGDTFPEIKRKESDVKEILDEEEKSFAKTLDRGEKQFEIYAQEAKIKESKKLHGSDVWRLYDTFGFPVDLTKLMAEERSLDIDEQEFEDARLQAKEASKGQKKVAANLLKLDVHDINSLQNMSDVRKTNDNAKFELDNITSVVKAIYYDKRFHDDTKDIPAGQQLGIVLDRTNFYAEQGGQEYDTGKLIIDGVAEMKVDNVQSYAGYILHTGFLEYGSLSVGTEVTCEYDDLRRRPIKNNHTGTHILNYALREVLGDNIDQKGSLVDPKKLRFDFSHKAGLSDNELEKVEDISTKYIRQNCAVYAKDVPLATAREIYGVRAVFGETYPDPVRVVSVGVDVDEILANLKDPKWGEVSIEFCGGTHVQKTGDIKDLVIIEESGIAKGIRRIIAYTGSQAHKVQRDAAEFDERLKRLEASPPSAEKDALIKIIRLQLPELTISAVSKSGFKKRFEKIEKIQLDEQKAQQKLESKKAVDAITKALSEEKNVVIQLPISANSKTVQDVLNHLKTKEKTKSAYVFAADQGGKVIHGCYVADDLSKQGASAADWSAQVSEVVGGKAGGKAPTSIGNGIHGDKVKEALEVATKYLEKFSL